MKMTESDAQKALDEFWEMVEKKYGPDRGRIDDGDRKKLFELEKQFDEARKSDAANN
jgi:hypothetical protein